jgi:hypothetical protein
MANSCCINENLKIANSCCINEVLKMANSCRNTRTAICITANRGCTCTEKKVATL